MTEFRIRLECDEDDRTFIRQMNECLSSVINAPTHSNDEVRAFQDRFTESSCNADARVSATFMAVDNYGQRLGYVNVREGMDDIANEPCGYIALLAVVAEAEGKGVGQALLQTAERWTREMGFRRLSLDVFASNGRGQQFYEMAGFRPETVRLIKQV